MDHSVMTTGRVAAVLFDLDDTLFEQSTWLHGAWRAVADAGARLGADRDTLVGALESIAAEGTDRGGIIDRAVARVAPGLDPAVLVAAFASFRSGPLPKAIGAHRLRTLRGVVPTAIVTDGNPLLQRDKLAATGLDRLVDVVVCSDDLGRQHRKPSPVPFLHALAGLGVPPTDAHSCVMVGDRPSKDIDGAAALGMTTIRVRTGEHRHATHGSRPTFDVDDLNAAMDIIDGLLGRGDAPAPRTLRMSRTLAMPSEPHATHVQLARR